MEDLNALGQKMYHVLDHVERQQRSRDKKQMRDEKVHVVGAGSVVTAAYEQLRNAAENSEEHLLLKNAVRRYYNRLFMTRSADAAATSAEELVTELTFAGYIPNDSIGENVLKRINKLAASYYAAYAGVHADKTLLNTKVEPWVVDVLAVDVARLFQDGTLRDAYAQFAFEHFKQIVDISTLFPEKTPRDVDQALFIGIQRSLVKADEAMIRAALLTSYQADPSSFAMYCRINTEIDTLLASPTADKLARYVSVEGAPLRVVERMLETQSEQFRQLLSHKKRFLGAFEEQVGAEYATINRRINRGIVKSIVFLVITKFLIGIAIEVPYDYMIHGGIIWPALLVNLFFPPLYMMLLRTTLTLPTSANTIRLTKQAEEMFYDAPKKQLKRGKKQFGAMYNVLYALFMLAVFGGVAWLLFMYLHFDWLHLLIFFVFLSGASFLGFRLSRMIREIESVETRQNGVTLVRDFLYMPFVVVGRWISEKYSQVNVVALVLDMLIELPLKTVLRLIRQWSAFISVKKDQL